MIKAMRHQLAFGIRQPGFWLAFFVLFGVVAYNFLYGVSYFQGMDIQDMILPVKILTLSYNRTLAFSAPTILLMQVYPLVVVCPAGLLILSEKQLKVDNLIISRVGPRIYYYSKLFAAFILTFLACSLPMFIEFFLNLISFPQAATGDLTSLPIYYPEYQQIIISYPLATVNDLSPRLYALLGIVLFGLFSGLVGTFIMALTAVIPFKFKLMVFIPSILLFQLPTYFPQLGLYPVLISYLLTYSTEALNWMAFRVFCGTLFGLSILAIIFKARGDHI